MRCKILRREAASWGDIKINVIESIMTAERITLDLNTIFSRLMFPIFSILAD
jgi:hypothetical protein